MYIYIYIYYIVSISNYIYIYISIYIALSAPAAPAAPAALAACRAAGPRCSAVDLLGVFGASKHSFRSALYLQVWAHRFCVVPGHPLYNYFP